jgi:hypothetical protein
LTLVICIVRVVNSNFKEVHLSINKQGVNKVIIRKDPFHGKVLTSADDIGAVIDFFNSITYKGKVELKPGWVYTIDIIGQEKQDIMIEGNNFFINDIGHKVASEDLKSFKELYKNLPVEETEIDKKVEVIIESEISAYTPAMSSVPGIPLNAKIESSGKQDNIKFHWVTEQGTILNWQRDTGKITILGKDIKTDEQMIYWSIDINEKSIETPFKIYLKVEDSSTSEVLGETSIQIQEIREGFYSVKK